MAWPCSRGGLVRSHREGFWLPIDALGLQLLLQRITSRHSTSLSLCRQSCCCKAVLERVSLLVMTVHLLILVRADRSPLVWKRGKKLRWTICFFCDSLSHLSLVSALMLLIIPPLSFNVHFSPGVHKACRLRCSELCSHALIWSIMMLPLEVCTIDQPGQ